MRLRPMTLTRDDAFKLNALLNSEVTTALSEPGLLREFSQEVSRARLVSPEELPDDFVAMNSTITLRDLRSQALETYTLVYPVRADIANRRLSVLSPAGVAVLGCRCGDHIPWSLPSGWRLMTIESVVPAACAPRLSHV